MAELIKKWNEGDGNLTASYEGSGDGSAVFSSDVNEGIDRQMTVAFKGGLTVERNVTQVGLREEFVAADGEFATSEDEIFGVLKG